MKRNGTKNVAVLALLVFGLVSGTRPLLAVEIYDVTPLIESRSISFENPTGEKGMGGLAKSHLGVGRKGAPAKTIKPGQTIVLCDINGPGVIRHMWLTLRASAETLQGIVIRAFWDMQEHPSVESPIGPFFGIMHGQPRAYQSAAHSVNEKAGMNCWLEMPFVGHAKITISNESPKETPIFYNIDLTIGDTLPNNSGRLHCIYRRENPTTLKQDFEILPKRTGQGRYIGCVLGIRQLDPDWWGEGEFKVYLDGDKEFPTICGTGVEDLIGQSWGLQNASFLYGGTSLQTSGLYAIYRWHIKDPIYWKKDIRITIQQIGYTTESRLFERQDDWSACSFWYEPIPSKPLHDMPDYNARVKDYLPKEKDSAK